MSSNKAMKMSTTEDAISSLKKATEECIDARSGQSVKEIVSRIVAMGEDFGDINEFAIEFGKSILEIKQEQDLSTSSEIAAGKMLSKLLEIHMDDPNVVTELCSNIYDIVWEYEATWQDAVGRGQGCVTATNLLRKYIEQPKILRAVLHMMCGMLSDEDGNRPKNQVRFRKAGACEVIVEILKKYTDSEDDKIDDEETVTSATYHLIDGIAANSNVNKRLFEEYEIPSSFAISNRSEDEHDSGTTSEEESSDDEENEDE